MTRCNSKIIRYKRASGKLWSGNTPANQDPSIPEKNQGTMLGDNTQEQTCLITDRTLMVWQPCCCWVAYLARSGGAEKWSVMDKTSIRDYYARKTRQTNLFNYFINWDMEILENPFTSTDSIPYLPSLLQWQKNLRLHEEHFPGPSPGQVPMAWTSSVK